jgi:hypothetical protein
MSMRFPDVCIVTGALGRMGKRLVRLPASGTRFENLA